jgi:ABC-type transport system involved in cytochrome c biogenesis ATPase subunit
MTVQPAQALGKFWQSFLAKRQYAQERKRIEHADKMKHALTVLESLRSWNLENGNGQA